MREQDKSFATETMMMRKQILCLDFDGVLHSYKSGWKGATVVPDAPTPHAIEFLHDAGKSFNIVIHSSRFNYEGGIEAVAEWLFVNGIDRGQVIVSIEDFGDWPEGKILLSKEKPPAFVMLDDRALTFLGKWPTVEELLAFKTWQHKDYKPLPSTAYDAIIEFYPQIEAIKLIKAERQYQDDKWGGNEHDDAHTQKEWIELIRKHLADKGKPKSYTFEKRMVRVAAIALAALEATIRNTIDTTTRADEFTKPPNGTTSVKWNPMNKVVLDHRDGTIDHELTNIEREKRGLRVPWTPMIGEAEVTQPPVP